MFYNISRYIINIDVIISDTIGKIFTVLEKLVLMIFVPMIAIGPPLRHGFRERWSGNHEWR